MGHAHDVENPKASCSGCACGDEKEARNAALIKFFRRHVLSEMLNGMVMGALLFYQGTSHYKHLIQKLMQWKAWFIALLKSRLAILGIKFKTEKQAPAA
eukprot:tig00000944_g5924.t1